MGETLPRYRSVIADSARWDGFKFRDDDIIISTPPKCGTTWMQMICALLIFQDPALPAPLTDLSPWLDMQTKGVADVFAQLAAQQHRRFIKTHTPLDGIPFDDRVTYICVGRDPRDVALSWDNHFANMNFEVIMGARAAAVGLDDLAELAPEGMPQPLEDPVERFWQWVEDDAAPTVSFASLKGTLHHLGTFWDQRDACNIVLFHYADLKADLQGEMGRLAATLGIVIDPARWPALVSAATFDSMRERADRLAPVVTIDGFWRDNRRFFNQGSSDQWRSFINEEDLARYEARVKELAPPHLAAWAHHKDSR